jgi:hypothetical protein
VRAACSRDRGHQDAPVPARTNMCARFQVLTAAGMKMAVSWVVAPCCLVEVYRRFRGACCLYHQHYDPDDSHLFT